MGRRTNNATPATETPVAENQRLRDWIRSEGMRTHTCTYDVLGEICEGCRCKRYYAKQGYGQSPNAPAHRRRTDDSEQP
jgi:hypothetical protein